MALARQGVTKRFVRSGQRLEAARIERMHGRLSACNLKARALFRACLGEEQRPMLELESSQDDLRRGPARFFGRAGQPFEAPCDHQVDDEKKVLRKPEHEALADSIN